MYISPGQEEQITTLENIIILADADDLKEHVERQKVIDVLKADDSLNEFNIIRKLINDIEYLENRMDTVIADHDMLKREFVSALRVINALTKAPVIDTDIFSATCSTNGIW